MTSNPKEYQKIASRKHYLANKEKVKARTIARKQEIRAYVDKLKSETPCTDCGNKYPPYVMDFDHLPQFDKVDHIAVLANGGSWKKLLDEIKKCELVCSNCHRIRTHGRLA